MSFIGDSMEEGKKFWGWKSGSHGYDNYKRMWKNNPPGPYDYGFEQEMLSKRAWRRLPHAGRKSIIAENQRSILG